MSNCVLDSCVIDFSFGSGSYPLVYGGLAKTKLVYSPPLCCSIDALECLQSISAIATSF
jgi:hypothetical protein